MTTQSFIHARAHTHTYTPTRAHTHAQVSVKTVIWGAGSESALLPALSWATGFETSLRMNTSWLLVRSDTNSKTLPATTI
jgi:hypothetical protein